MYITIQDAKDAAGDERGNGDDFLAEEDKGMKKASKE
jgi:hypothetical protein